MVPASAKRSGMSRRGRERRWRRAGRGRMRRTAVAALLPPSSARNGGYARAPTAVAGRPAVGPYRFMATGGGPQLAFLSGRPAVGPYQSPFPNRCRGTVAPSDSLNEKGGGRFSCPRPFVCGSLSLRRSACGGRASALQQRTACPSRVRAPHYSSSASC